MTVKHIPKTITKKLYVTLGVGRFNFNDINVLSFDSTKYMSDGHEEILSHETEITIELPKKTNAKDSLIAVLRKRKKDIEDQCHANIKEIQYHINSLLDTGDEKTPK